jgi:hypothetical protein
MAIRCCQRSWTHRYLLKAKTFLVGKNTNAKSRQRGVRGRYHSVRCFELAFGARDFSVQDLALVLDHGILVPCHAEVIIRYGILQDDGIPRRKETPETSHRSPP